MDHPVLMRELEPARCLKHVSRGRLGVELAGFLDRLAEIFALDEFHAEVVDAVLRADVVDLDDVVMSKLCGRVGFARETDDELWIVRQRGRENFQRDVSIQRNLLREVDRSHPALTEFLDDVVPANATSEGMI